MAIRILAVAAVVLGGCSSLSKHITNPDYDYTGAMWTEREKEAQQAQEKEAQEAQAYSAVLQPVSTTEDAIAGLQGTGSQGGSMGGSSPDTQSGSGTGSSSGSQGSGSGSGTGGSSDSGSTGMGQSGSGAGGSGMGQPGSGSADPGSSTGMGQGGMKGHGADHKVMGKVSEVSSDSITVKPSKGEAKTLKISPETKVTMNGKSAEATQLKQGQQVRVSYMSEGGEDHAVKIDVGGKAAKRAKGSGASGGTGGGSGSGASGSMK